MHIAFSVCYDGVNHILSLEIVSDLVVELLSVRLLFVFIIFFPVARRIIHVITDIVIIVFCQSVTFYSISAKYASVRKWRCDRKVCIVLRLLSLVTVRAQRTCTSYSVAMCIYL